MSRNDKLRTIEGAENTISSFFNKQVSTLRSAVMILLMCSLLLTAGCDGLAKPAVPTTDPNYTTATVPKVIDPIATAPTETNNSLATLRQEIENSGYAFAAAYFGDIQPEFDSQAPVDPVVKMPYLAPKLCQALPFLLDIPKENVIGVSGDMFCIVPSADAISVEIYMAVWNGYDYEYTDLLYEGGCEPVVLFCNDDGWEPDSCVIITNADGTIHTWYPYTDDRGCLGNLLDSDDQPQILDFSAYAELLRTEYFETMGEGWLSPTKWDLIDTTWSTREYMDNGTEVTYILTFDEDTLCVKWNDGIDEEDHIYPNAPWDIQYVDGITVLTIDFQEFAGILKYNLLLDPNFNYLYTTVDMSEGAVAPVYERMERILTKELNDRTNYSQLIGTWKLGWTMVEDDWDYSRAGTSIITITGDPEGVLHMSFRDDTLPNFTFTERELYMEQGEIYVGCGNDKWYANVDHIGPYGTTYKVTVLNNDILMMQQLWYVDEYPMVSYAWYNRAD